ncbi:NUDIX hydrolase [Streptomyces sp. NPDC012935]|uniref:NUDIX hydrolase n=1 Tax=Streptomyces sp. NPDC012935 TaxID=3364857 RepID=UPI0036C4DE35
MAVRNSQIESTVREYLTHWPDETEGLAPLTAALQDDVPLCGRYEFQGGGHVTCGAAVLNSSGDVLFILNRPLDKWLLPGGHLELTDPSLHAAAVRELVEETGIPRSAIGAELNERQPLDIGLYQIPANPKKNEPAHWHADFCFGFLVDRPELHLQVSEIGGFAWKKSFDDLIPGLTQKLKSIDR